MLAGEIKTLPLLLGSLSWLKNTSLRTLRPKLLLADLIEVSLIGSKIGFGVAVGRSCFGDLTLSEIFNLLFEKYLQI